MRSEACELGVRLVERMETDQGPFRAHAGLERRDARCRRKQQTLHLDRKSKYCKNAPILLLCPFCRGMHPPCFPPSLSAAVLICMYLADLVWA
ncbi:hypothetical protein BDW60DRAFT_135313 [Aspergillus nidulans var. acristatus]